jgi:hypothetical protein
VASGLLELDGVDYRPLPLSRRKDRLARQLARVQVGIALNEHTDARGGSGIAGRKFSCSSNKAGCSPRAAFHEMTAAGRFQEPTLFSSVNKLCSSRASLST